MRTTEKEFVARHFFQRFFGCSSRRPAAVPNNFRSACSIDVSLTNRFLYYGKGRRTLDRPPGWTPPTRRCDPPTPDDLCCVVLCCVGYPRPATLYGSARHIISPLPASSCIRTPGDYCSFHCTMCDKFGLLPALLLLHLLLSKTQLFSVHVCIKTLLLRLRLPQRSTG